MQLELLARLYSFSSRQASHGLLRRSFVRWDEMLYPHLVLQEHGSSIQQTLHDCNCARVLLGSDNWIVSTSYYAVEHCQLTLQLKEIREDFVIYTHLPSYVNSLLSSSVNIAPYKL